MDRPVKATSPRTGGGAPGLLLFVITVVLIIISCKPQLLSCALHTVGTLRVTRWTNRTDFGELDRKPDREL
jgi:hypothetical protein